MGVAMMNSNRLEDESEYDVGDDDYFIDLCVELWQNAWFNSQAPVAGTVNLHRLPTTIQWQEL